MTDHRLPILILGGTGRLGRALARVWPADRPALWQHRPGRAAPASPALPWEILGDRPRPDLPPLGGILSLAGPTGNDADLRDTTLRLARAAAHLGHEAGCRVLLASSQAVYVPSDRAPGEPLPETAHTEPVAPYGRAKRAMELAVAEAPHVTCLRLGNVVGCDALAAGVAEARRTGASVMLDRFADGRGPRRAMIGAGDLAAMLPALFDAPDLPPVLNVARRGSVGMEAVLEALGQPFDWQPAGEGALPDLALDVSALSAICDVPPADARALAAQGWPA